MYQRQKSALGLFQQSLLRVDSPVLCDICLYLALDLMTIIWCQVSLKSDGAFGEAARLLQTNTTQTDQPNDAAFILRTNTHNTARSIDSSSKGIIVSPACR